LGDPDVLNFSIYDFVDQFDGYGGSAECHRHAVTLELVQRSSSSSDSRGTWRRMVSWDVLGRLLTLMWLMFKALMVKVDSRKVVRRQQL
jgi:hypothetical protein